MWADELDNNQVGFEYVPVHTHAPILPIPLAEKRPRHEVLTTAVIQGEFNKDRRQYDQVYKELLLELKRKLSSLLEPTRSYHIILFSTEDAAVWGYRPLSSSVTEYVPDPTSLIPPFQLHLVGRGTADVPDALKHLVVVHSELNYLDFYKEMSGMDVEMLAFRQGPIQWCSSRS